MPWKRVALALAGALLATAAQSPPPPRPQAPKPQPARQQRDLSIEKIESEAAPPKTVNIPRSYAVIIGISGYRNLAPKQQLHYPEEDARAIHTVLISAEGGNFKAENVHILIGAQATLANMRREIDNWLPSVAKDGDRVLIYFAGHGFMFQGKGYLAPSDFNPGDVTGTGYPMDELGAVIGGKIRAQSKILLTDACHAGAITPEDTQSLNRTLSSLNTSLFSLTASRDRESSFESETLQHGVFTYYVVQGLGGAADTDHDGVVTADELADYVRTQVREATGRQQNPTSEKGSFDPQMLLSYVPANVNPAAPPAPRFGTLVFEANRDDVEVFVDGVSKGVLSKDQTSLVVTGLQPGEHTVKGVRMGWEPDGPRPEMVRPGETSTVTFKLLIPRRRKQEVIDLLDKGLEYYQNGGEQNYRKAAGYFEKAFQSDPTYSQAAYYLGQTYNALFDEARADQWFQKAIRIDPDYLDARASYAGMLLDTGGVDEALRQINDVLLRQPNHVLALTLQAQAYRFKALYAEAIQSAREASRLSPGDAEPHLWMADSLRLSGRCAESRKEYNEYLRLSDFDSKLAGQLNYYVIGSLFGMGRRKHASQHDIWKDLRSLAYFGICDCGKDKASQLDSAIGYCQKALAYDAGDPFAHFALGIAFMYRFNRDNNVADLPPAKKHFEQVIQINPDLEEATKAKENLAAVQDAMQQLGMHVR